jgi:hypothetical protein
LPTGTPWDWTTIDYPNGPPRLCPADAQRIAGFNKLVLVWGCLLVNDNGQGGVSLGRFDANGTRPDSRDIVEVGVAASPRTNMSPAHVSVMFALPRRRDSEEKLFFEH